MSDPVHWQKSSFSGGGDGADCIQVAADAGEVLLRESDDPQTVVRTSPQKLRAFILGVKAGEFDHFTE